MEKALVFLYLLADWAMSRFSTSCNGGRLPRNLSEAALHSGLSASFQDLPGRGSRLVVKDLHVASGLLQGPAVWDLMAPLGRFAPNQREQ